MSLNYRETIIGQHKLYLRLKIEGLQKTIAELQQQLLDYESKYEEFELDEEAEQKEAILGEPV